MFSIEIALVSWPLRMPFTISRETMYEIEAVMVKITDFSGNVGVAEAVGVGHAGETASSIILQLEAVRPKINGNLTKAALQALLPPGGARNALDCAMWDLEAKRSGVPCWKTAGLDKLTPQKTAFTLGIMSEADLRRSAFEKRDFGLLKVKTNRAHGLDPVRIVHEIASHAEIIVDPNEDWTAEDLEHYGPLLRQLGVVLLEQPVSHECDDILSKLVVPVPVAADEAFIDSTSIAKLVGKYQVLNIKLDKTGGLTEALRCVEIGRSHNFGLMVGCMAGSSLAMAPATIIAQNCAFVDLDGPLLQTSDCPHPIAFTNGYIGTPSSSLWG